MTKRELIEALAECKDEQEICIPKGNKYLVITGAHEDVVFSDGERKLIFVLENEYDI